MKKKCGQVCEVYSRVCGYFRPTKNWNTGKREEFKQRKVFDLNKIGQPKQPKLI